MFRPNETHRQQHIFELEMQMSPELRKRLRESKEYAFYEEVFCRIPEALFAGLYDDISLLPRRITRGAVFSRSVPHLVALC